MAKTPKRKAAKKSSKKQAKPKTRKAATKKKTKPKVKTKAAPRVKVKAKTKAKAKAKTKAKAKGKTSPSKRARPKTAEDTSSPKSGPKTIERIRTAKGRRPYFFDDPNFDRFLAMFLALVSEVSVLRERLDTHERLAEDERWPNPRSIESYRPTEYVSEDRAAWRDAYVARILRILTDELERLPSRDAQAGLERIMKKANPL